MDYWFNNKQDQELLLKKEQDEDFVKVYTELLKLYHEFREKGIIFLISPTIKAKELNEGIPKMVGYGVGVIQPLEKAEVEELLKDYIRRALILAMRCASFFPVARRWKWQNLFYLLGLTGGLLGVTIKQEQNGGRHEEENNIDPVEIRQQHKEYRKEHGKVPIKDFIEFSERIPIVYSTLTYHERKKRRKKIRAK